MQFKLLNIQLVKQWFILLRYMIWVKDNFLSLYTKYLVTVCTLLIENKSLIKPNITMTLFVMVRNVLRVHIKLLGKTNILNFYLSYNFISKRSFTNLNIVIFSHFVISSSFTLRYMNVQALQAQFLARSGVIVIVPLIGLRRELKSEKFIFLTSVTQGLLSYKINKKTSCAVKPFQTTHSFKSILFDKFVSR